MKIELTDAEATHLRSLMHGNAHDGDYYGNPEQYWKRHKRLLEKLSRVPCSPSSNSEVSE